MLHLTPSLTAWVLGVTALLGLVMGSFLHCLAWRLVQGESILRGRSHCPRCGHALGPRELIPVVSWLAQRGRCRWCGAAISPRYPAVELLTGGIYVSIVWTYDVTLQALWFLILASLLLTAALVDLEDGWIPDRLILTGLSVFVLSALLGPAPLAALGRGVGGSLAVTLPLLALVLAADRLLGRDTMGGGDLKLLFMMGLYFDWQRNFLLLLLACFLGIVLAAARGKAKREEPFPFGPALSLAAWVVMLAGTPIIAWYLALFGL